MQNSTGSGTGTSMHRLERSPCPILLAVVVGCIVFQAFALLAMGHPAICTCGQIYLWHGNPSGPETSQHLTDWYTYTHLLHGFGFYLLLWLIAPGMPVGLRLVIAVGLEVGWEIVENTPLIMDRYRQSALARGYFGDSIINSIADTFAATVGFALARVLPIWVSVTLVIGMELFAGYAIRDNLMLNIIQLVHPSDAISRWQTRN
jgi:hypothetical protein